MVTKSSVVEIQNIVLNPKSRPIRSKSERFLFNPLLRNVVKWSDAFAARSLKYV